MVGFASIWEVWNRYLKDIVILEVGRIVVKILDFRIRLDLNFVFIID